MLLVNILLIVVGALPWILFFIKRKRYYHILRNGIQAAAQITEVRPVRNRHGAIYDQVFYAYLPKFGNQYFSGLFTSKTGKYRRGDSIEVFYLPDNPKKNAMPGSKGEMGMLIFLVAVFLFILFACYKLNGMVGDKEIYFNP